jgi:anti-sigma factor RsiW
VHGENDRPLTEEERELARKGEELIAAAVADVRAPQSLREAIERDRERAAARERVPFWRRHRWGLAVAGVAAAALAAVAIALETGGNETEPSLTKVYAASQLAPTKAAPAPLGGSPPVLDAKVGNLKFPDWRQKFGWRAVGRRDDSLSGRPATTVFYRNPDGARLGYTVVSGDPLGDNPPGRQVTRKGKTYSVAREGARTTVTWTQQGHTCAIVASSTVPQARLVDLAASRNV